MGSGDADIWVTRLDQWSVAVVGCGLWAVAVEEMIARKPTNSNSRSLGVVIGGTGPVAIRKIVRISIGVHHAMRHLECGVGLGVGVCTRTRASGHGLTAHSTSTSTKT